MCKWCVGICVDILFPQTSSSIQSSQKRGCNILTQLLFPPAKISRKPISMFQKSPRILAEPSFCFLTNSLLTLKTKGVLFGTAIGFPFDKNKQLCGSSASTLSKCKGCMTFLGVVNNVQSLMLVLSQRVFNYL